MEDEFKFDEKMLNNLKRIQDRFENATSEEVEQLELEEKEKLRKAGFLPRNEEYYESMNSPMVEVENNPKARIIEECIPACQILWRKNIYTYMTSDYFDNGISWIEIKIRNLSSENRKIYEELDGKDVVKFKKHDFAVCFGVNKVGRAAQRRLAELAENFVMQDVPNGEAYKYLEDFLIENCSCFDEVDNPDYKYMAPLNQANVELEKLGDYIKEYDEWLKSKHSIKTMKVLNTNKINKSIPKYIEDFGYILDNKKVYFGTYHFNKHLNYLNSIKS